MYKHKEAIKLVMKEGTTFDMYFSDGVVKRFDMLSLVDKYPFFNKLKDRQLFLNYRFFSWGGIVWDDELDIDCELVYFEGKDVTKEYDDIDNALVGYAIKKKRISLSLTQEELAKKSGIDQSDLSKIEKGNANPTVKMISRLKTAMGGKLEISIK